MRWIKFFAIQAFIALLALEVFSLIASNFGLLVFNDRPSYSSEGSLAEITTEEEPWGAWRQPETVARFTKPCFDVEVRTNEVGARDDSFTDSAENSVIILGDSFAEGYGVGHSYTAASHLETLTGREFLNFGMSSNFGPLQQLIIYEQLAYDFSHEKVLVFVLPRNDFSDNERRYWAHESHRFRPYYGDAKSPLSPFYFAGAEKTSRGPNFIDHAKGLLLRYTWSSNTLRTVIHLSNGKYSGSESRNLSSYLTPSVSEQQNLVLAYQAIVERAGSRAVSFVVIPDLNDIEQFKAGNVPKGARVSAYWYQNLRSLAEDSGGEFVDLLDHIPQDVERLFHSCDGHWSENGNRWAAEVVSEMVDFR